MIKQPFLVKPNLHRRSVTPKSDYAGSHYVLQTISAFDIIFAYHVMGRI